jgi:hypothetical protein
MKFAPLFPATKGTATIGFVIRVSLRPANDVALYKSHPRPPIRSDAKAAIKPRALGLLLDSQQPS